ncbi:hypothetical protein PANI_CDS0109 [Maribacter phage Panino]
MHGVGIYVVIKPKDGAMRSTNSGLEIPTAMSDRFLQGEVISASDVGKEEFGLEKGQNVLYDKHSGHDVPSIGDGTYRVVTCRDIAVIL